MNKNIEDTGNIKEGISSRLDELLDYVHHLGKLNQKPIFKIEEYKSLNIWEHELKGRIGIQHNVPDSGEVSIWLRIERLKRILPPIIPGDIHEWVFISNDPEAQPEVKDKIIKTIPEKEVQKLVENGTIEEKDITSPLKTSSTAIQLKDVIIRLNNNPELKLKIENYINEQWIPWSEEEKPRRETIKIYDSFFSLQQTIEIQGEEQPFELIWGIGIGRWNCEGHQINFPMLEKPVEIELHSDDGAILIRPRNMEPNLAVDAYFALENPGVDVLLRFAKKHFSELSEDLEFSPYIHESFEPILRQAAAHLSESGVYWPDINPDKENRKPNKIGDTFEVTDSWLIFARPRSATSFVQDIERFQAKLKKSEPVEIPQPVRRILTELSDKKPLIATGEISHGSGYASKNTMPKIKQDLFFPKPFNDAQIQIIDRLEENDGVVVQGPPGTGKTHTIANIICHYLATGRNVLVTSKGESALSVLQEQIPEEIRSLTISLLTNEIQGMKQLEAAVQLLAGMISQTGLHDLKQEAVSNEQRVKQLEKEIQKIDLEIKDWGLKQLNPIAKELSGTENTVTDMELAQHVMSDASVHKWFPDKIGSSHKFKPQFSDSDIVRIREARRSLGKDIVYVEKNIPSSQDMPDSANITAIHEDLANSSRMAKKSQDEHIPPLAVSVDNAVDRSKALIKPLNDLLGLLKNIKDLPWLENIFHSWLNTSSDNKENINLFEEQYVNLDALIEQRQKFVKTVIQIDDPSICKKDINDALKNLKEGKKPFGLFSFGHKEAKDILDNAKFDGDKPESTDQWRAVFDYLVFQDDMRKFIIKWNHIGQELKLPNLTYKYGELYSDIQLLYDTIKKAKRFACNDCKNISDEITQLFPHGINVEKLSFDKEEIEKAIQAIDINTSRVSLGSQRIKLQDLTNKLKHSDGDITKEIHTFIKEIIGSPDYSADTVMKKWQDFISELERLHSKSKDFECVSRISDIIAESGAIEWAKLLKTTQLLTQDDDLTPVDWHKTWQWKQQKQYLVEIEGREEIKKLSTKRTQLDKDLKRTFSNLVKIKTNIGLHLNMTERVQGALMRFVSAVAKIGKGTGKRAPRYKRDAYKAMQDCYGGVPCWIMPTWRISESLPSEFGSFDLVIIDEASQSDITALPAIMRAKKLLIVGDDKQVSPTAAFFAEEKILQLKHNFLKDQPFAELVLPGISIYDLASAVFPSQRIMLTEHFRCVEPIIRFSMQFYTEPLIPLRIPKASEKLTPPLIDVYVKLGKRDERKKINETEADAIVSEISRLVDDPKYSGRNIGVVSLTGAQQAQYIQKLLLSKIGEDKYQKYKIACGDAAAFQGKEKDIVFLSMVVGPGQGAVLNKREYEQRINVALSRARDRMYLYRSVQENDLTNEADLRLKILRHFSNPMPQQSDVENLIDLCDSDFERDVFKKLLEKGYNVFPQVKVGTFSIDIVVEGENDRRLAIELDGDKYHPPEKWMEDWKRQRVMERVGWKFWRCWGSSYTIDPDGCIEDLVNTLEAMQIQPSEKTEYSNIYTEYRVYEN